VDVARTEMVEAELDTFISRRHDKRAKGEGGERAAEEAWQESARRETVKLREATRAELSLYYEHMAELHTRLAEEHRQKAQKLLEEGAA
jgi:hypothetical protein